MIGVIGLGRMGYEMALRLRAEGEAVLGFDLLEGPRERAAAAGVPVVGSVAGVADACTAVLLSLPNPDSVRAVVGGQRGLLRSLDAGSIVVDTSTVDPETAITLGAAGEGRGVLFVDAPVSGGVAAARAGTLVAILGGTVEAYERARRVLAPLASDCYHAGPVGSGQVVKICQQLLAFGEVAMLAEALAVAEAADVDRQLFADVVLRSSAGSRILNTYGHKLAASEAADVTFSVTDALKDQRLYTDLARSRGIAPELGEAVERLYSAALAAVSGSADVSALATVAGRGVAAD